ncbi:MAG: ATP-binding protein [Chiayiivirga sp.]|jgi:nitrogen fixation/metabolism regulation signal transduction histidine kinase|uniref:sensor histidine kinase n=1 Tax=Chiayiivirga sp. TaxID=2041042 RepID=UPI0025C6609A|nr:ATP-binding protein [Chiayiivirga sp.]MCI1711143.1 ATP-binding protein [Chiayiivirga sp.]MCI1728060.1 ATP-binding protein [Chiayiivirga sp.]
MVESVLTRQLRLMRRVVAPLALLLSLLSALYLAADAEGFGQDSARYYPYVFVGAALALGLLLLAIVARLWRLRRQLREGVPGARLTRRLLLVLVLLAVPPVFLVYGFGVRFIAATVDSWLRIESAQALDDGLAIAQLYLDERLQRAQDEVDAAALQLTLGDDRELDAELEAALDASGARQLAVFERDGRVRAVAAADPSLLLPAPPEDDVRLELNRRGRYAAAERDADGMHLRVVRPLGNTLSGERLLQGLFALPDDYALLAQRVETALHGQRQAIFLRDALKFAFALILSFVALLSVLLALLLAFDLARRLVAPVARMVGATGEIAQGRYDVLLPENQNDELGVLARSFNQMTRELEQTSARARASAEETERQRAFLETVLAHLSSGVLVLDAQATLRSANGAARELLGIDPERDLGTPLPELRAALPLAAPLLDALAARLREGAREWREEVALASAETSERRVLLLRGARLPDAGAVAVFDDATVVDRARREAAWSEVARRLAHEIKNPLTPIQLAAERLRRRVLPKLSADDGEVLDRATHTIVAQVDALKNMVNSFGDYARPPALQLATLDLNRLVAEVLDLYEQDARLRLVRQFDPALPPIRADSGRLRQVLHNLLKNAIEATAELSMACITLETAQREDGARAGVEIAVSDNGTGLPSGFDEHWFEPYRSTKARGTGLGLAIVAKIAQEHGGRLRAADRTEGGARFSLWLPLA